jgi:hypothetical protein
MVLSWQEATWTTIHHLLAQRTAMRLVVLLLLLVLLLVTLQVRHPWGHRHDALLLPWASGGSRSPHGVCALQHSSCFGVCKPTAGLAGAVAGAAGMGC